MLNASQVTDVSQCWPRELCSLVFLNDNTRLKTAFWTCYTTLGFWFPPVHSVVIRPLHNTSSYVWLFPWNCDRGRSSANKKIVLIISWELFWNVLLMAKKTIYLNVMHFVIHFLSSNNHTNNVYIYIYIVEWKKIIFKLFTFYPIASVHRSVVSNDTVPDNDWKWHMKTEIHENCTRMWWTIIPWYIHHTITMDVVTVYNTIYVVIEHMTIL